MPAAADLAALIASSQQAIVFSGAGISTESGIPDFRSPGGVWSKMKPIYYQDFVASPDQRREAWRRVYENPAGWTGAKPNKGHQAIAKLVEIGKVSSVITQNVDNLHQDGGVPEHKVIELHGNASYAHCLDCGAHYTFETLRPRWEADEDIRCDLCGGLVKSAVVSFGEAMPEEEMMRAGAEAEAADLCLVLGSSLVVYPAASIPLRAKQTGAKLVIVNREPTEQDQFADLVLHTDIGPLLTEAIEALAP